MGKHIYSAFFPNVYLLALLVFNMAVNCDVENIYINM